VYIKLEIDFFFKYLKHETKIPKEEKEKQYRV